MVKGARRREPKGETPGEIREARAHFLVVEKRAGYLVHSTPHSSQQTLLSWLRQKYGFVKAVHRLDREVSGLLVFARSEESFTYLVEQFRAHRAERRYLAAVRPPMQSNRGTIRSRLAMNQGTFRMYEVQGTDSGRLAVTHWWKVRDVQEEGSLVEVALQTGVKNQIRVHFAAQGHPIWGEQKYLPPGQTGASSVQKHRLFLHAAFLGFDDPGSKRRVDFESALPRPLSDWLEQPHRRPWVPRVRRQGA